MDPAFGEISRPMRNRCIEISFLDPIENHMAAAVVSPNNMTLASQGRDVEREKMEARKAKPRQGFLQKYHHKGAFYIDDDTVQEAVRNTNVAKAGGGVAK